VDEFLSSLGFEFVDARPSKSADGHVDGEALTGGKFDFASSMSFGQYETRDACAYFTPPSVLIT